MTDNDNSNSGEAQGMRSLDSLDTASQESGSDDGEESSVRESVKPYIVKAIKAYAGRRDGDLEFEEGQMILVYAKQGPWDSRRSARRYHYGYYFPSETSDRLIPLDGRFLAKYAKDYHGLWSLRKVSTNISA